MKKLLQVTTTLLLLNVSIMADGSLGATKTDCSAMSDITGVDSTAAVNTDTEAGGNTATN